MTYGSTFRLGIGYSDEMPPGGIVLMLTGQRMIVRSRVLHVMKAAGRPARNSAMIISSPRQELIDHLMSQG
jgi:hypothetical protein